MSFPDWLQSARQMQQAALQQWSQMLLAQARTTAQAYSATAASAGAPAATSQPSAPLANGAAPVAVPMGGAPDLGELLTKLAGRPVQIDPARLLAIQAQYLQDWAALWQPGQTPQPPQDKRFAAPAWQSNPLAAHAAAVYALNARTLRELAQAVQADAKTRARIDFALQQWIDASAPSNFLALNPEAQQKAIDTRGESLNQGLRNLLHDIEQGHVSMTDESAFEVGQNVATTAGQVVFENELFQLIQYQPLTEQVHERPFLLVPPCINKFYILDLQPENSLVRYAVEQGMRTFVLSWRNPDASCAHKTWDDYIEHAVLEAIRVVQAITRQRQINALGFCVGGTMLGTALAVLAARGEKPVASATFLTSLLDFTDTGVLDVFIDEAFVKLRELQFAQGGLLPGRELATTFNFLRPNDLVWNYVVGNYLKGESPPPFDLLYWNSDSTNLPGPYYAWYLRHTYLENRLCQPGSVTVCGVPIDLGRIDIPAYVYGSREDHIVPPGGAYASTRHLRGPLRFVLGASGHIAGVINPARKNKRSHWIAPEGGFPPTLEAWLARAEERPGSWWTDWAAWLKGHAGKLVAAPKTLGSRQYPPIEPAPGRYVKAKA